MFKLQTKCRACESTELVRVFSLGNQPLANDFKSVDEEREGFAPLEILFCPKCTLAQLSVVVDPNILYSRNYPYVTSKSDTMQKHFQSLWKEIKSECQVETVCEIGSNDGLFLKFCKDNGADSVIGIDPATNLAKVANDSGITTICDLFDECSALVASRAVPPIDVVVARHVFCHVDNWKGFISNLEILAGKPTLIVIEAPYVIDFLKNGEWDTCYHEHTSYFSVKAMESLLEHTLCRLHKIVRFPIHGGVVAVMLRRRDCEIPTDKSVDEFLNGEKITIDAWKQFSSRATEKMEQLKLLVGDLVLGGKTVCGFGASAKSTVMVQACEFTREHIDFICDSTPNKQGKLSPGNNIPIVSEEWLLTKRPDYAIMFCWNFAEEVIRKNKAYLDGGGHFIIPMPEIKILGL